MQSGIISRAHGASYGVILEGESTTELHGALRGRLRLRKAKERYQNQRHLLTIGDRVGFSWTDGGGQAQAISIEDIFERQNALERSNKHEIHCLGANLRRAVAVVSLVSPEPHFGFVDRFLCAAYAGGIEPWLVFSKADLFDPKKAKEQAFLLRLYQSLGYSVFCLNLLKARALSALRKRLRVGTSLFLGQSGVGKSTLFNQLLGREVQQTRAVNPISGQGRHTTTSACLLVCPNTKAFFIDTPGLREWGLYHLQRQTVLAAFAEIRPYMQQCRFADCSHEAASTGCAVEKLLSASRKFIPKKEYYRAVIKKKLVHPSRLRSLASILASLKPVQ